MRVREDKNVAPTTLSLGCSSKTDRFHPFELVASVRAISLCVRVRWRSTDMNSQDGLCVENLGSTTMMASPLVDKDTVVSHSALTVRLQLPLHKDRRGSPNSRRSTTVK